MDIPDELIIETLIYLSSKSLLIAGAAGQQFKTLTEVPYVVKQLPHITLGNQLMLKDSVLKTRGITDLLVRATDSLFEENDGLLWCLTIITGNNIVRDATWRACRSVWCACRSVSRRAFLNAAGKGFRDAAQEAVEDVVWEAIWEAAGDPPGDAAFDAKDYVTQDASWKAFRDAAWQASRDAVQGVTDPKDIGHICYQVAEKYILMNLKDSRDLCKEILDEKIPDHRSVKPVINELPGNPYCEQYYRLFN